MRLACSHANPRREKDRLINVNSKRKLFGPKEPALLLMLHSANDDLVNRLTQTKQFANQYVLELCAYR